MLDGFIAWLSEANGRLSFFVVPVQEAEKGFSWTDPSLIGAMIGAGASAIVALSVLWLTLAVEKSRRQDDELRKDASKALKTFTKLSRHANSIHSVRKRVDEAYEVVRSVGGDLSDPSTVVGPFKGDSVVPELLSSDDYKFLYTKENFQIVGHIEDLESSSVVLRSLTEEYSRHHDEIQRWLDQTPGIQRQMKGILTSDKVPKELAAQLDRRIGQMNLLIANIIDIAEAKDPTPDEAVQSFIDAARKSPFGKYFPKLEYGSVKASPPSSRSGTGP